MYYDFNDALGILFVFIFTTYRIQFWSKEFWTIKENTKIYLYFWDYFGNLLCNCYVNFCATLNIIVSTGANILRHQLLGIAFSAIILISTCIFQATGNGKATMISTLSRQGFIFLPILFTVSHLFGFHGVLFAQPITDFLTAILIIFILYRTLKKSGII